MYKLNLFLDQILWLHIAIFIVSTESLGGHQGFTTPLILASLGPLSFLPSSVAAVKWHPKEWNWDSPIKYGDIYLYL